jgi:hypothetical protein
VRQNINNFGKVCWQGAGQFFNAGEPLASFAKSVLKSLTKRETKHINKFAKSVDKAMTSQFWNACWQAAG